MADDASYEQYHNSLKHCIELPVKPTADSWTCMEVIGCWKKNLFNSE
jgi:hypothetical protein